MSNMIFVVLGLLFAAVATAIENSDVNAYICIPDYSTGYTVDGNGKWEPTQFDVQGQKFILKQKENDWVWLKFGEDENEKLPDFFGERKCGKYNDYGFLHCTNYGDIIRFNKQSLRFQVVYPVGYVLTESAVHEYKKRHDTPYIKIGTCSPL